MTENDGKSLETLVQMLEMLMLPRGFSIDIRKKVFDEKGNQIAEFDIVIKGDVGSASFECLIECRDRPSDGVAPASWIEQLNGRKDRFKFDKVMAVSTTGFSEGAISEGERTNIELRNVDYLTPNTISSWLPFHIDLIIRHGEYSGATLRLLAKKDELKNIKLPNTIKSNVANILLPNSNDPKTIEEIWQLAIEKNSHFFERLEIGQAPKDEQVRIDFSESENLRLITDDGNIIEIEYILFDAKFSLIAVDENSPKFSQYREVKNDKVIARVAEWRTSNPKKVKSIALVQVLPKNR